MPTPRKLLSMGSPANHRRRDFLATLAMAGRLPFSAQAHEGPPKASFPTPSLATASDDFLFSPGLVYLQTGSLGPTPRPVIDRTLAAWKELELNPVLYGYGALEAAMEEVREKAAAFLGAGKAEIVLTSSTTEGMNWVAQGLGLAPGDRILTTDQEHPGGRVCWDYVARKQGVLIDTVAIPPEDHDAQAIVDRFARSITPRTRALSFSHVLSSTGLRMPVRALSELARKRGCLAVVDGAQAAGAIDVNVRALGCHVYATSGHKWLLGPKGTGLLYLSEEISAAVDPIALQGGRAAYSESSGFRNIPGVIGLAEAVQYLAAIGMNAVESHNLALRNGLYAALRDVPKVRVVSAPPGPLASPLLTFVLPAEVQSRTLYQRLLDRHHVVVKVVPTNWLNGNRISTHLFNTERDLEALVSGLRQELG